MGCFDFLAEQKRLGRVRYTGFSFHDTADVLDGILTRHPEVDVVQLQLNYLDWDNPIIQSGACWEVCRKHGKPILVMQPVKGGPWPPSRRRRKLCSMAKPRPTGHCALRRAGRGS
jgi:predicted aldo/keto reductase-like oxidoreductase